MKIKYKLVVLLGIPLIAVLYFSSVKLFDYYHEVQELENVVTLSKLAGTVSAVVHESQKERGMSAGYIGSKGVKFKNKLREQYKLTDNRYSKLLNILKKTNIDNFNNDFSREINKVLLRLEKLTTVRQAINNFEYSVSEAVVYYTLNNSGLLNIINNIVKLSPNADIAKESAAYVSFLQSKERAGIERAVLSNTFGADKFSSGFKNKFVSLIAKQDAFMDSFNAIATKAHQQFLADTLQGESIEEVKRMRSIALQSDSNFNIDPVYWFATITKKINLLKKVENKLADNLYTHATSLKDTSLNRFRFELFVVLAALTTTLIVARYLYKSINESISSLSSTIKNIEKDSNLTIRANESGNDEISELAGSLNAMMNHFSKLIDKVSSTSNLLTTASNQVSDIATNTAEGVNRSSHETEMIATAMEEMSATVQEIAENAVNASKATMTAHDEAQSSKDTVKKSMITIKKLSSEIDSAAVKIKSLEENSTSITAIVEVIKSIAEQTNLLALNAAIEAARAGEQGRGFAVVADEVRTLASRTQESTIEIEDMVSSLQTGAQESVVTMQTSQNEALLSVEQAEHAVSSLENIVGTVASINDMNMQIASAAEQQKTTTDEMTKNTINIGKVSEKTATEANDMKNSSIELLKMASLLQSLTSDYKVDESQQN